MKVLFAIRDEDNIVDTIVRKYQQDYKKKMTYKEAKNFTAIIRELQQNNDYDSIVISEDINQKLKNSENGESAILKKLKNIVEITGNNTSIIYICDNKAMVKKLLEMNIYNIIIGRDKIKRNIYDAIIDPKNKKSAFEFYGIKDDKKTERNDKVKKNEKKESTIDLVRNIKYLNRDDLDSDKYIKRFDNLCSKLDKDDIEIIIKSLNTATKRILRRGSTKYKRFVESQKKSQLENNNEKVDIKENASIVEDDKKRRGRPRKDKKEEEEASVKRGRGRPRKVIEDTTGISTKKDVSSKSTTEKKVKTKKTSGENQNKEKVAAKKSNKKIEGQPKKNEKSDSKSESNSKGKRNSTKKISNTKKSDSKRKKEIIEDDDKLEELEDDFFEVEESKTSNKNADYKNQKAGKEEDFDLEEDIDLDDNLEQEGNFSIDGDDLEDDLDLEEEDLEDEDDLDLEDEDLEDEDDLDLEDEDLEDEDDLDLEDEDLEDEDDLDLEDEDLEDEDDLDLEDEDLEDEDDIELDDEDLEDEDDIELDDEDLEDEDDIELDDEDLEDEDDIELDDEDLEDEDDLDPDDEDSEDEDDLEDEDDIELEDEDLEDEDDIELEDEDLEDEDDIELDDEDLEDEDDIELEDDGTEDDDILNLDDDTEDDDILNLDDDTEDDDILNLDDGTEDDDILNLDDDTEDDDILNLDDDTEDDNVLNIDDDTEDDDVLNLDDDTEDDDVLNIDDDTEDDDILNLDDDTEDDDILNLNDDTEEDDDIINLDDDTEDDDILNSDDDTEEDDILKLDDDSEDDDIINLNDDTEDDSIINLDDEEDDDDILKLDDNEPIGVSDKESFSGIKNKNYNPNYNISKQLNEIDDINTNVEDSSSIRGENSRKTHKLNISEDQKVVAFVGGHGNGTSFIINNLASLLSEQGIKTAVLDLTKNKNSYYIYTENEENLRSIAFSCFEKLRSGISDGIKVNKNLTVFTTLPNSDDEIEDKDSVINTLLNNNSLILLDCDVETDLEYFTIAQEIYLVQTLDILTIQPLTSFLKKLKMNKALDEEKIRILINKDIRVNDLNDRMLISAMSVYNSPDTTYQLDLFNRDRAEYLTIPFEERNYAKYLGELAKCKLKISGYSKALINSFNKLARMVYPINGRKK